MNLLKFLERVGGIQMTNQKEMVLQYMRDFGSITPMEAIMVLHITRLSARIFELRRDGFEIVTERERKRNLNGRYVEFARYSLKDDMIADNMNHIPSIEQEII